MSLKSLHSRDVSHHTIETHMIYLANQNNFWERHLRTRQEAANQNKHKQHCDVTQEMNFFFFEFLTIFFNNWKTITQKCE